MAVWWTICLAEAAAYHQRTLGERPDDYGAPVRERLQAGLMVPAVQYLQARRARHGIRRACAALFEQVDLLVLPATPAEAPTLEAASPWACRSQDPSGLIARCWPLARTFEEAAGLFPRVPPVSAPVL